MAIGDRIEPPPVELSRLIMQLALRQNPHCVHYLVRSLPPIESRRRPFHMIPTGRLALEIVNVDKSSLLIRLPLHVLVSHE